jgi:HEAT repeat protein
MKTSLRNHTLPLSLVALVFVAGSALFLERPTPGAAQALDKLNHFVQSGKAPEGALQLFAQGRDLLQEGAYREAAARFNRFITEYPRHQDVDAALYWLAYSLAKLERFPEAERQLDRLFRSYPKSNWVDDARTLRVQIAGQVRDTGTITHELETTNHELKSIALQSLFHADPERAAAMVADLLKPTSTASPKLKETAVMLLAQHGGAQATETLLALARGGGAPKLQRTAIFWLSQTKDPRALDLLLELVQGANLELARAALLPLAQHSDARARQGLLQAARNAPSTELRREAIFWLGQHGGEGAFDELGQIYSSEKDLEVKKHVLFVLSQTNSPRATAKLQEVARAGEPELRKQAIFWLGQRADEPTLQSLIQLYEGEQDIGVKEQLVFALSQSRSKAALTKLMHIARQETAVELRKKAVFWLGQSNDPEARKFIEEILK